MKNSTIFAKGALVQGYQEAIKLLYHQFREIMNSKDALKITKNLIMKNSAWNYYMDNDFNFSTGKEALEKAINSLDERLNKYKIKWLKSEWGHDSYGFEEVKEMILKVDHKLFNDNPELKNELISLNKNDNFVEGNPNKEIINFLKKNRKIGHDFKFVYFRGRYSTNLRRTWEEYINGMSVNKKNNFKTQGKKPSFINDIQIHISREWFEEMEWVRYKKVNNLNAKQEVVKENLYIEEILNDKALKNWFEESVDHFKNLLIEVYGNTDKFLGASLHLDETKPHINIHIDNFEEETVYFRKILNEKEIKQKGTNLERVTIEEYNNLSKEEKFEQDTISLLTSYREDTKWRKGNIKIYKFNELSNSIHQFSQKQFDRNLKPPGFTKNLYGISRYNSLDNYVHYMKNNSLDFVNDSLDKVIDKLEASMIRAKSQMEWKSDFTNVIKEIKIKLANGQQITNALKNELALLIRNEKEVDKILNNLIQNSKSQILERNK